MQGKTLTHRQAVYAEYRKTPAWHAKREAAYDRDGKRCRLCNRPGPLVAHHRTYDRIFKEDLADLTTLCHDCHELFHKHSDLFKHPGAKRAKKAAPVLEGERYVRPLAAEVVPLRPKPAPKKKPIRVGDAVMDEALAWLRTNGPAPCRVIAKGIKRAPQAVGPALVRLRNKGLVRQTKGKRWVAAGSQALVIACPKCGVGFDEPCRDRSGRQKDTPHASRVRRAA